MADSDGEYMGDDRSDDDNDHQVISGNGHGTRSSGALAGPAGTSTGGGAGNGANSGGTKRRRAAWEDIQRSWDTVVEGADGSINSAVEGLLEASKRKR